MYWTMEVSKGAESEGIAPQGRFVLHRHRDADGKHLDLRLEAEGYVAGYRIGGVALRDGAWATEKLPHPLAWLEQDGDAVREDAGVYAVPRQTPELREVELRGSAGTCVVRFERECSLDAASAREVALALRDTRSTPQDAGQLLRDGAAARAQALRRLCALGRELDGAVFDESRWRRMLSGLSLEELHGELRSFEARFDARYPPQPVSQPEPLEDDAGMSRLMALVRGG
ncbi:MAG: hypothetical protein RLZZ303_2103 [Candidatus Hydrogenedentota bacterium]